MIACKQFKVTCRAAALKLALGLQARRSSEHRRLSSCLRSWRAFAAARREASAHAGNLAQLRDAALQGKALQAWSAAVQHSNLASACAQDLAANANLRRVGRAFGRWTALPVQAADTSTAAELMHARAQERHLTRVLQSWQSQVHAKAAARAAAEAMGSRHDQQALQSAFDAILLLSERGHDIEVLQSTMQHANTCRRSFISIMYAHAISLRQA